MAVLQSETGRYIGFVYTASTILAIWSFAIVFDLCKVPLESIHIKPKFYCLQLVLFVTGIQRSIIEIFVITGYIVCEPPLLPDDVIADRWNGMIVVGEMFLLAIVARIFYRHTIQVRMHQLEDMEQEGRTDRLQADMEKLQQQGINASSDDGCHNDGFVSPDDCKVML